MAVHDEPIEATEFMNLWFPGRVSQWRFRELDWLSVSGYPPPRSGVSQKKKDVSFASNRGSASHQELKRICLRVHMTANLDVWSSLGLFWTRKGTGRSCTKISEESWLWNAARIAQHKLVAKYWHNLVHWNAVHWKLNWFYVPWGLQHHFAYLARKFGAFAERFWSQMDSLREGGMWKTQRAWQLQFIHWCYMTWCSARKSH